MNVDENRDTNVRWPSAVKIINPAVLQSSAHVTCRDGFSLQLIRYIVTLCKYIRNTSMASPKVRILPPSHRRHAQNDDKAPHSRLISEPRAATSVTGWPELRQLSKQVGTTQASGFAKMQKKALASAVKPIDVE